ncbi:hypothetical protein [Paraburkholderia sp. RL17-337-BIB-A]|uniref:hypothetical protein n=1 Tax=Paraburkholderia sp. RL17-337-BIB-A TaxID=3031636 RepID=UPI0038BBFD1E
MSHEFTVETGLVAFSVGGRAQFGWLDLVTGSFHSEADGQCINDAIVAVEFSSDVVH